LSLNFLFFAIFCLNFLTFTIPSDY
jgi:hypothetical protein